LENIAKRTNQKSFGIHHRDSPSVHDLFVATDQSQETLGV
jgi:hypothetical protein